MAEKKHVTFTSPLVTERHLFQNSCSERDSSYWMGFACDRFRFLHRVESVTLILNKTLTAKLKHMNDCLLPDHSICLPSRDDKE